jgi:Spy/CpxP family protein refolding chaperone
MRPHVKWLLTAVLAALFVSPALGQLPLLARLKSMMENGVDKPILLANDGVKKEIKLTDEQDTKVRKIVRDVFDKYQPEFRKAKGDREKQVQLVLESTKETRERLNKALPDILSPEQLKRLDQIQIQVNGIASFKRQDVQKKLNLTDEQKAEIRKIGEGLKEDAAEVLKDASSAPLRKIPGAIVKVKELKNTATQKAIDKLTSAQQQTWQEMIGEKFDFKLELLNRQGVRP